MLRLRSLALAAALLACAGPEGVPLDEAFVAHWAGRAEEARGLDFTRPVSVRLLDPGAVRDALALELAGSLEEGEIEEAAWAARALGLLPAGVDLRASLLDFGSEGLVGFFSPRNGSLFVVGEPRGPVARLLAGPGAPRIPDDSVLVHELVHALQAEHTELALVTLGLRDHDDLAFALAAVLEGDALWSGFRDLETHEGIPPTPPPAYALEMQLSFSEEDFPEVPRILREPLVLQYASGYAFADEVASEGGTAGLDAMLADPPLSSEQLLHPDRREDRPVFPVLPDLAPPGCTARHANTLGEVGVRVWLAERRGAESRIDAPAAGWDGDRVVVWDCDGTPAFAWLVHFDSERDADEFAAVAGDAARDLGAEPRALREGRAVLVSVGVSETLARRLLREAEVREYATLADYLADHPEVLERARRLRAAAAGG